MQSSMDDAIIRTIIGVQEFKTYFNIMIHFIIYMNFQNERKIRN